ncbi:hypothetical protein HRbin36_01862 [bacterium HR36]|nr:hypothetical protein HRbin36_01862 [bacterium HR36]
MLTSCPKCAVRLRVADGKAGKAIRCPKCQNVFRVPEMGSPAATSPEPQKPPVLSPRLPAPSPEAVPPAATKKPGSAPPVSPPSPESPRVMSGTADEAPSKKAKARRLKKKKRSGNAAFFIFLGLGIFIGLALLAGGGIAVWYFAFRKTADRAAAELLDILESLTVALEKAKDNAQRSQAVAEINAATQRLERWIERYQDCEWSEREKQQVQNKYEARAKELVARLFKAVLPLAFDPQAQRDAELKNALERFGEVARRMPKNLLPQANWQNPPPGPKPFAPTFPSR